MKFKLMFFLVLAGCKTSSASTDLSNSREPTSREKTYFLQGYEIRHQFAGTDVNNSKKYMLGTRPFDFDIFVNAKIDSASIEREFGKEAVGTGEKGRADSLRTVVATNPDLIMTSPDSCSLSLDFMYIGGGPCYLEAKCSALEENDRLVGLKFAKDFKASGRGCALTCISQHDCLESSLKAIFGDGIIGEFPYKLDFVESTESDRYLAYENSLKGVISAIKEESERKVMSEKPILNYLSRTLKPTIGSSFIAIEKIVDLKVVTQN